MIEIYLKKRILTITAVFFVILFSIRAKEIYVSNSGSDKSSGSRSNPLRSLQHASKLAQPGDSVILRGGVYREALTISQSGTKIKPILFKSAKGEKATVSGANVVTDWRPYKGKIMQASIPVTLERGFNQVFLDGRMMPLASHPNQSQDDDLFEYKLINVQANKDGNITSEELTQPDAFWNGGFVVGGFGHAWTWQCADIKDYKKGRLIVENKSNPWWNQKGRVYLTGVLGALDAPGEWYVEKNILYFWPPDGVDLKKSLVEVKQRNLAIDFNKQSYINVSGIDITKATVLMVANHSIVENSTITYPSHFSRFNWNGYAPDGGASDGYQGILLKGTGNLIKNCEIRNSAGSGIVLKGSENLITRCEISNIDYSGTYSCPITVRNTDKGIESGKNRIWFNTIYRTGRDCIQLYGANAEDIRYNDVSESGLLCKDLGVIYVYGRDGKGTRIAYNWIHDNRAKNGSNPGIYLDNYCSNFIVDHNVVWNCEAGVRINAPAKGHEIYNNTLFNCKAVGAATYNQWPNYMPKYWREGKIGNIHEYIKANNLFLGNKPDQQLTDVNARLFQLKNDAPAIDAGKKIPLYTEGFKGNAPDLGAYETGMAVWTAGHKGKNAP